MSQCIVWLTIGTKKVGVQEFVFVAVAVVFLAGCSSDALQPLNEDAVILAFGDSLTEGRGTTRDKSYPAVLEELTGFSVANHGVSGETSAEGLARLPRVLRETQPSLMLLMHGGNDILRNMDHAAAKSNIAGMIQLAAEHGVSTVLIGIPEKSLFSRVAPFYREVATASNILFEDEIISKLLKTPGVKSDTVHFNARGYRAIAERIYELLKEHGAL